MQSIVLGMTVKSLDDRPIGQVIGLHPCCLEYENRRDGSKSYIKPDGIFDVQTKHVVLICFETETHRYACGLHSERQSRHEGAREGPSRAR